MHTLGPTHPQILQTCPQISGVCPPHTDIHSRQFHNRVCEPVHLRPEMPTDKHPLVYLYVIGHLLIFPLSGRMLNPLFTKFPMLITSHFQLMSRQLSFILVPKHSERLELLGILVTMRSMAPVKMGFSSFLIDSSHLIIVCLVDARINGVGQVRFSESSRMFISY